MLSGEQSSSLSEEISSLQPTTANTNVQGDYSGITGSRNTFNSDNVNSGNTNTGNLNIAINQFQNKDSPPTDAEIFQCLYTSNYESHVNRVREPAEGTCVWVTEHEKYTDWLGKKTSGLLWLSADPGCGKSVIAAFLVKRLKLRPDAIVCYFFFKDDTDEQKNATFALCAILHQLFAQRNQLCRYAHEAFKTRGTRFAEEIDTLWGILVKAVAEGGYGDVICVVDALDECDEKTRAQLIRHLARLPASHPSGTTLKVLVTSRPYHEIAAGLGTPTATIRLKGEDEIDAITTDVNRVIDEGIKDLESYWGRPGGLGYLRDLLESSADHTFLWVSLILEILKASGDDSRDQFSNIVSDAPRDLAELYTKILDKSKNPDTAHRILHIVVGAARPLSLREINVAFRIRQEHTSIEDLGDLSSDCETTVKDLCGLFVRIIDTQVYLVHQTAREFLIKGTLPGKGKWQYTLCPLDSSFILANICITYLLLEDFENDPASSDTNTSSVQGIAGFVQKYPLLHYAANHWAGHFRDLGKRQMELFEATRLICKPESNRLLTWLKVYWENSGQPHYCPVPDDFTHLMVASWFGHRSVVKRLLKEGEINARSKKYGTALNVAAIRQEKHIAKMLMKMGVKAFFGEKEFNILLTSQREITHWIYESERERRYRSYYEYESECGRERDMIEFQPFCFNGIRDLHTFPTRLFHCLR